MDGAPNMTLKKQEIIDEAYRLFYARGFHATGVDALLADTGISKRTLYKYFDSKEALIEAVLEKYLMAVGESLFKAAENSGGDAKARIRKLFEIKRDGVASGDYQGCLAIKAQQEYTGRSAGIESLTQRTAQMLEAGFAKLTREAGLPDPVGKARTLILLFQGATVASQMRRDPEPFNDALRGVDLLLG
jgi:AcrR family transcriptional regulator